MAPSDEEDKELGLMLRYETSQHPGDPTDEGWLTIDRIRSIDSIEPILRHYTDGAFRGLVDESHSRHGRGPRFLLREIHFASQPPMAAPLRMS